jgi:4-diphosphocytidyl-2-C-methyl-D-erythritol kinase
MPRINSTLGERVIQHSHGWVIHTPAKLNLFFELLRKREDGYHEIESLMVPISLYDTLVLEQDPTAAVPLTLDCRTFPSNRRPDELIPIDERNLVWRAVQAVRQLRELPRGLKFTLWKRIPSQAGLGGGSSDAAATLLLLDRAFDLRLNEAEMLGIASKLGSDVPFFLTPSPQIARGRGEILVPMAGLTRLHCVVIAPPTGLSTPVVYGRCKIPNQPRSMQPLLQALQTDPQLINNLLWNALEPAARELSEDVVRMAASVSETACLGQLMSGSGSSYFGLYGSVRDAARAAKKLRGIGLGQVFQVSTLS